MDSINIGQIRSAVDYYFDFKFAFAKYTTEDAVKLILAMTVIAATDYVLATYFASDLSIVVEQFIEFVVENL